MLALIIVLSCVLAFLLLILGLLLCPLKITVLYQEQVNLTLQYGPLKIPILPGKEKPRQNIRSVRDENHSRCHPVSRR